MSPRRLTALALVATAVATFVVYAPALNGTFLWDDDAHITAPALRSLEGLCRIWFELGATQQYYPLLHSFFWLQAQLWGDAPLGYHLVNLGLHLAVCGLFFVSLRRLDVPGALIATALFALHPVHVESVAWITEQKNTLSTALYLGALLLYLRFDATRRTGWYVAASTVFLCALATKTVTATLPAALLVIFWWQRGQLTARRDVTPLVPWLVVGAGAGLFTAWVEHTLIGAQGAAFDLSFLERSFLAGKVVLFYLSKLLWPADLTFIYPRWDIDAANPLHWFPAILLVALLLVVRRRSRPTLATLLLFAGSLFPVLGFFNVYPFQYSYVADHFQYLPSLAIIALVGAGLVRVSARAGRYGVALPLALSLILAALTWRQSHDYRDAETLYRATLARNPSAWMAHNNLGKEMFATPERLPEAIRHFEEALALKPDYAEALNNLGLALTQTKRPREALPYLERSIALKPGVYQTHNNLGIALASSGRAEEALAAFTEAARLAPLVPNIRENHGKALLLLGRDREAAGHFAAAAALRGRQP